ncbi:MAG: PEP-CTERM sorting domain-containing protein [Novosphingobium sp.]|nr:PEP-CTERM sorting domain-containing protein [Novosphingobium sp.]
MLFGLAVSFAAAAPALALGQASVPEPSDFTLFALGVLGLVLGRKGSRKRPPD